MNGFFPKECETYIVVFCNLSTICINLYGETMGQAPSMSDHIHRWKEPNDRFQILNMYISEMFLLSFISKQIINIKNISLLVLLVLNYTTMLVFGIRIHFLGVERQRNAETLGFLIFPFKYLSQIYISSNSEINSNPLLWSCTDTSEEGHRISFPIGRYSACWRVTSSNGDHFMTYQQLA